jgi:hypothetical protein
VSEVVAIQEVVERLTVRGGDVLTLPEVTEHVTVSGDTVTVASVGIAGPPGTAAVVEGTGDLHYTHAQAVPAAVWVVVHNLGKYPSVSVVDSGGTWVIGDVAYTSPNALTVSFGAAFAGTCYAN